MNPHHYRKLIIDSLQEIQNEFKTNELVYNGVYYWPILKVRLFFSAYNKIRTPESFVKNEKINVTKKISFISRIFGFFRRMFLYFYLVYIKSNSKTEILTSGHWNYRILDNGNWVNRYFVNTEKARIHFEYDQFREKNIDLKENSFSVTELFFSHKKYFTKIKKPQLEKDALLRDIIDSFNLKMGLEVKYETFNHSMLEALIWRELWSLLLKRYQPKEVRLVCCYNIEMYGLCAAAHAKSVPVIDMQHGVQGPLHSAYNGFGLIPEGGYNSVPTHFSVWDEESKNDLIKAKIVGDENILLEGNPWINFNKERFRKSENSTIHILYTLQTTVAVPEFVFNTIIETANDYKWVLKTHPRMLREEIDVIKKRISSLIDSEKVEICEQGLLLELLSNCFVHVSAFSGAIIESELMGKKTIIIDPIGEESFKLQIQNNPQYYVYADTKEQFVNELKTSSLIS
jgi:hypothetical protein